MTPVPRVLTIAGSDPSGGAGIQADLKTFTALGVYGMSAVTSITVQNTEGVQEAFNLPPELVYRQIKVVVEDIGLDAAKTGMLGSAEIASAVARAVKDLGIKNLVVDPILKSSSGKDLIDERGVEVLKRELLPLARLVTPNVPEAEALCGMRIKRLRDVELCAQEILKTGVEAVLIKGGHMEGSKVVDGLYMGGDEFHYFVRDRVKTRNTHGTGCTLSAAIAAFLAKGKGLEEAVERARDYLQGALERSLSIGRGKGPLNHMWNIEGCAEDF